MIISYDSRVFKNFFVIANRNLIAIMKIYWHEAYKNVAVSMSIILVK